MRTPKEIARYFRKQGIEMTPDEVQETLASIAAKFRKQDPSLPDDDNELLEIVVKQMKNET